VFREALEFSPDNADLLTTVGLLYLRLGENQVGAYDPQIIRTMIHLL
jgi:regulator of sirC expression with transglutaminase-like and TPR domain